MSSDDLPPGVVRSREKLPPPNPLPHAVGEGELNQEDLVLGRASRELANLARQNLGSLTVAEEVLWQVLRRKQLHGRAFRRQHPLGHFIADFYCDDARLIVEVDGAYHEEHSQAERDRNREAILQANNLSVLRFSNDEVLQQREHVLETLSHFVLTHTYGTRSYTPSKSTPPNLTPPPPQRGGGGWGEGAITAIEPQARRAGRVNVYVDGKFAIGLFEDVAAAVGLRVGQIVTDEGLHTLVEAETLRRAKEDALRLLSYRDRSEKEFTDRLRRKGYEEPIIEKVLEYLRAAGLVDDDIFAARWIKQRGSTRGRRALAYELQQKGVTGETLAQAMGAREDGAEREAAYQMALRRIGTGAVDRSPAAWSRLAAYLARRGFEGDTARSVLARIWEHGDDADDAMDEEDISDR